jgi:predicted regulator of Ras-like GTPase activity (Roadblock/LC7/MglB family)
VNEEICNVALRNALIGIKDAMADLNWSFILMSDGTIVRGDDSPVDPAIAKAASSFQTLAEKATVIGDLDNMLLNGEKSKVYVSSVNDMYLVAGLTKNADLVYFRTITRAVLPTVLKVLESVTTSIANAPTPQKPTPIMPLSPARTPEPTLTKRAVTELPIEQEQEEAESFPEAEQNEENEEVTELEPELQIPEKEETPKRPQEIPSQQLIVDRFSGFMVKTDTVQLDAEILKRWSEDLDVESVSEVDVETFSGRTVRCKTKIINDPKLEGRGLIRIPEKTCQTLDVRRGELVRVRPVISQEND